MELALEAEAEAVVEAGLERSALVVRPLIRRNLWAPADQGQGMQKKQLLAISPTERGGKAYTSRGGLANSLA